MRVDRYNLDYRDQWNRLVDEAKNSTFLFNRDYMDYHKDRFIDHSLVIFEKEKLVALFPANEEERVIRSHGGLSYGGLIYTAKLRLEVVSQVFKAVIAYYLDKGFRKIFYKCIPNIYIQYPASEMEYLLFNLGAKLYRRDLSSTIDISAPQRLSKGRKWLLAKARKLNISIELSSDFETFFTEYNSHLGSKYGLRAVHRADEMHLLQKNFPDNIKYFTASVGGLFLGGTILYFSKNVIHAQYIHFTQNGKDCGAFDLLLNFLLNEFKDHKYFDFGVSTENDGTFLNEGLLAFKESFGARSTVCDFYELELKP